MAQVNLMRHYPRTGRKMSKPRSLDPANRVAALKFGVEYFDGSREQGYGGYRYDGRWIPIARDIVEYFGLRPGHRVLDVGCAKGFLVKDLMGICPGLEVWGLDISDYALRSCEAEVVGRLVCGTADRLPFRDHSFDVVLCINVIHNFDRPRCIMALRQIERLARGRGYVLVDAYRNEAEREVFLGWVLTAITFLKPEEWEALFQEAGYTGDYYWTILDPDPTWNDFAARTTGAGDDPDRPSSGGEGGA
jgi:SAM-dependent methyltransferase